MARCAACEDAPVASGWLCEECAATIYGATRLLPEQIVAQVEPSDAVLVDRWGRTFALGERTVIGRELDAHGGIAISEASISRRHAEIVHKRDGSWWLVDLVSSNGTTVDDEPVTRARQLVSRATIFFGEIGCYFMSPSPGPLPVPPRLPGTHRPPDSRRSAEPEVARVYDAADDEPEQSLEDAYTFSGLREVDLTFASPSGGGGGVVELAGRTAQLTEVQYQLVRLLADRMQSEEDRDDRVRGFVRSSELLATLPWDTARPEDNHIKQLVRRVRRALVRAQLGDLIESRQGFGYRLRVRLRKAPPIE
jgi:hypothetical protein